MQAATTADTLVRRGAIVGYLCTRKAHLSFAQTFTITIHNGEWAFCHDADPVGSHRWMATGGIPLADVRRSTLAWDLATD
jgi:hypothetical protein